MASKGQRLPMAQYGLKLLGDACFTATFGLWSVRKMPIGQEASLFWQLGITMVK